MVQIADEITKYFRNLVLQHRPNYVSSYLSGYPLLFTLFIYFLRGGGFVHYRSVLQLPIPGDSFCPYLTGSYSFTDKVATK